MVKHYRILRNSLICQAINIAHNDYGEIRQAIIGVIFLGTPHHGSATSTMGSYLTRIFGILLGADGYLLRSLEKNHPALASAHSTFVDLCRVHVQRQVGWNDTNLDLWENSKCFYEAKPTMLIGGLISLGKVCIIHLMIDYILLLAYFAQTVEKFSASAGHRRPIQSNKDHSGMNKFATEDDSDYISICIAIRELADSPIARRHQLDEQAYR
jgi:hypothetical protein